MATNQPNGERATPTSEPAEGTTRLATLSHELSNLLDGSLRCLNLARTDLRGTFAEADALDRANRRLDTIWQSLERMASLVDGALRDGSRALGRAGGPVGMIPLEHSMRHAVEVLTPLAAAALTRLELTIRPGIDRVPTGPLYTPILNAVQNAIQAIDRTGRPGVVRIEAALAQASRGEDVVIRVQDSGPGVPPGFHPFAGLPAPGGHGIGLALSAAIVHALGGSVQLANATDGSGGAVFVLRCPMTALSSDRAGATP